MMNDYKTPATFGFDEFTEKRSRFIGFAKHTTSEKEATAFISKIKSDHSQASHNCWAYHLREGAQVRFSDDGEPGGTAGVPIFEVIKKTEIFDVAVVVTRYYGGVQLGAGGLARAYSKGARIALAAAGTVLMCECVLFILKMPYNFYDKFLSLAASYPLLILKTTYTNEVELEIRLKLNCFDLFNTQLTELFSGTLKPQIKSKIFSQI